ncbi:MAG: peptidylprolyl isomerase [Planctomycetes bacterium]|nr:peptidylprolyl isomerase [Planctomycetota bacterium]
MLIALQALGCRSAVEQQRLELLELESARCRDPARFEQALLRGDLATRRTAAVAIGRIRARELAPTVRRALAVEEVAELRGELLFALGQIGAPEAADVVLRFLDAPEVAVRARAVEALGKLGSPELAPNLVARLGDPTAEVRGAALLGLARLIGRRRPASERGPIDGAVAEVLARTLPALVADRDPGVAWKAAYVAAEIECEGRLPALRLAAQSSVAEARFFAAAALGRASEEPGERAKLLLALLADPQLFVAAQAAAALGRLDPALERAGVRAALTEASNRQGKGGEAHLRAAAVAALVARVDRDGADPQDRQAASAAVALGGSDPYLLVRAEGWRGQLRLHGHAAAVRVALQLAKRDHDRHERVAAARALAAATLEGREAARAALIEATGDADAYVASEAWSALAPLADDAREELRPLALAAASHPDFAVAANALDLLKVVGEAGDLATLAQRFDAMAGEERAEARANAVNAAAALAGAAAVPFLAHAAEDPAAAVRTAAVAALQKLDGAEARAALVAAQQRIPPVPIEETVELDADEWLAPGPDPRVRLSFARGDVVVQLFATAAPRHARLFRERVAAGACDGLPIHRIVSGFVVQGFDPRGDGWGTGGVVVRDEIGPLPFERGVVGMPNAGPDSGGCQFFAMLMPAPHLDGRYTVYGKVIEGLAVLDALDLGERCLDAEVIE